MTIKTYIVWFIASVIASLAIISCGTGTIIEFGKDGIKVVPPSEPIVIPTSEK